MVSTIGSMTAKKNTRDFTSISVTDNVGADPAAVKAKKRGARDAASVSSFV
jgi:hypothetical protein